MTQTGWWSERCKIHLICCDSAKNDSLMMSLKCKSLRRYMLSPQFVSNNIKAFPPLRHDHCEFIWQQGEMESAPRPPKKKRKKNHLSVTWKHGASSSMSSSWEQSIDFFNYWILLCSSSSHFEPQKEVLTCEVMLRRLFGYRLLIIAQKNISQYLL